jgi:Fe2+ transport system protein FeoA
MSAPLPDEPPLACPLCGARFSRGVRPCAACPLSAGCDVVCCPRCGYSFPRSSRVVEALKGLFRRWRRRTAPPPVANVVLPLSELPVGREGRVVHIAPREPMRRLQLSHLGVMPGALVCLQQIRPAAVVRVGETMLALDPEIAAEIYVRPTA